MEKTIVYIPLVPEEQVLNDLEKNIIDNKILKRLEVEMKLRGFSEKTMKSYIFYNQKFLEYIEKSPENMAEEDIKEFLANKLSEPISNGTISLIKASLKFYYGEILGKKLSLLKTPRTVKKLPTVLSKKEITKLLKTKNMKHKLLIELLYSAGLRLSECANIKYQDLDINENIDWVRNGKGGKDRIFIIAESFKKDLLYYKENRGYADNGYIFTVNGRQMSIRGIQHAIKISVERAGIEKNVHVHTLRHSLLHIS